MSRGVLSFRCNVRSPSRVANAIEVQFLFILRNPYRLLLSRLYDVCVQLFVDCV